MATDIHLCLSRAPCDGPACLVRSGSKGVRQLHRTTLSATGLQCVVPYVVTGHWVLRNGARTGMGSVWSAGARLRLPPPIDKRVSAVLHVFVLGPWLPAYHHLHSQRFAISLFKDEVVRGQTHTYVESGLRGARTAIGPRWPSQDGP